MDFNFKKSTLYVHGVNFVDFGELYQFGEKIIAEKCIPELKDLRREMIEGCLVSAFLSKEQKSISRQVKAWTQAFSYLRLLVFNVIRRVKKNG